MLHFAVPVFFFVSGALVWAAPFGGGVDGYVGFLRRRASRILVPYLAWSAAYLLLLASSQGWVAVLARSPMLLLSGKTWYHLYFVPALFVLYLLTPLASRIVRRQPELLLLAAYALRLTAPAALLALERGAGATSLWSVGVTVTVHVSEMALGAWFAVRTHSVLPWVRRWWPILIPFGSALLLLRLFSVLPHGLPRALAASVVPLGTALEVLGLAGLTFAVPTHRAEASFVRHSSALAYGVYLSHPLAVLAWNRAVVALGLEGLWHTLWFPAVAIASIAAASFAVSALLARRPTTARLVGL